MSNNIFSNIDTEDSAYWLGFVLADGSLIESTDLFQVNISRTDKCHLQKMANLLDANICDYESLDKRTGKLFLGSMISLKNMDIWKSLLSNGIKPMKTYDDDGVCFDKVHDSLMNHFVRGFFDGDGSINNSFTKEGKENCCFGLCGTTNIMDRSRRIISNATGVNLAEIEDGEGVKIVRWSGRDQISAIYKWLYKNSNVWMERKRNRFDEIINRSRHSTSRYRGVTWYKPKQKWNAYVRSNGKRKHLGYFDKESDAALAFNVAALQNGYPAYKINEVA